MSRVPYDREPDAHPSLVYAPWRLRWTVLVLAALVLLLGGSIYLVFFTSTFTVTHVTVVEARDSTKESVTDVTETFVREQASLFGEPNIFLVDRDLLEKEIVSAIPSVRTAKVERRLPGVVKIIVQERAPVAIYYSGTIYYYVDQSGTAYERVSLATIPGIDLPIVKDTSKSGDITIGSSVLSETFLTFIAELAERLPQRTTLTIAELTVPSVATREVIVRTGNGWRVLFNVTRPVADQLNALEKVLNEIITVEDRDTLEYIDLRIPNKVFFR